MWWLTGGELHYVRTIENCTLSRPRNVVLVFPNNAINYVDVEVMAAGACVCQQTGNRDAAEYCTVCTNFSSEFHFTQYQQCSVES